MRNKSQGFNDLPPEQRALGLFSVLLEESLVAAPNGFIKRYLMLRNAKAGLAQRLLAIVNVLCMSLCTNIKITKSRSISIALPAARV